MITHLYIDTANLYKSAKRKYNRKIDYRKLDTFLSDYNITLKRAYGVRKSIESRSFIDVLKSLGYLTTFIKKGTNLNVDMTVDVCKSLAKTNAIILITNDCDIYPLIRHCKEVGVVVYVYGIGLPQELNGIELGEDILLDTTKNESESHMPTDIICNGT